MASNTGGVLSTADFRINSLYINILMFHSQKNAFPYYLFKLTRSLNFRSSVCLRLQPWATDKREQRLSVIPKSLQVIFYRLKQSTGKAFCFFEELGVQCLS